MVTRAKSGVNADLRNLTPLADRHGIPVVIADGLDEAALVGWLQERRPDVVFCLGWSRILGPEVLAVPPRGVVGYHPAALPANRGRHPIVWALALGLERTGSTFFLMDEGPDSGPLVSQRSVAIAYEDDASTLYRKLVSVASEQIDDVADRLALDRLEATPQDHSQANYWRKRDHEDGRIDWRMSSRSIYNLVRALTRPYVGAHARIGEDDVKVWRVTELEEGPANIEPGKVLAVEARQVTVRCGAGAVRLEQHELAELPTVGSYL